mgnify:CR=1 FL=1|jgi:hypothetical protein
MWHKKFQPILFLFIIVNAAVLNIQRFMPIEGLKTNFILVVNALLFGLSFFSFKRVKKMDTTKPHLMVQSVMVGTILKMVVLAGSALVYASQKKGPVGMTTLLTCMGLYLMYMYFEIQWSTKKQ